LNLTLQNFNALQDEKSVTNTYINFIESLKELKYGLVKENKLPITSFLSSHGDLGVSILGNIYFTNDSPLDILNNLTFFNQFSNISNEKNFQAFINALRQSEKV
jgi:hypothetical protein